MASREPYTRNSAGHEKTISGRERTTEGRDPSIFIANNLCYIIITTPLFTLMVSTRAQHVVRGEISDDIILLAMWQSASRAGLLPRLVGYSVEKHIPRFVLEFYSFIYNNEPAAIRLYCTPRCGYRLTCHPNAVVGPARLAKRWFSF